MFWIKLIELISVIGKTKGRRWLMLIAFARIYDQLGKILLHSQPLDPLSASHASTHPMPPSGLSLAVLGILINFFYPCEKKPGCLLRFYRGKSRQLRKIISFCSVQNSQTNLEAYSYPTKSKVFYLCLFSQFQSSCQNYQKDMICNILSVHRTISQEFSHILF